jgi:hypothetical protein
MATSFPGLLLQCLGSPKRSDMEQVISGVAIQRLRSTNNSEDGPGSFFSTLPKSIIPRDVIDFILQFIDTLEKRWDQLLKAVEDYPRSFVSVLGRTRTSPMFTCENQLSIDSIM